MKSETTTWIKIRRQLLRALEIDMDKFMDGEYRVQELLYWGSDGRLYHFETGEPVK